MIIQDPLTLGCTCVSQVHWEISLNQKIRNAETAKLKNFLTLLPNQFLENSEMVLETEKQQGNQPGLCPDRHLLRQPRGFSEGGSSSGGDLGRSLSSIGGSDREGRPGFGTHVDGGCLGGNERLDGRNENGWVRRKAMLYSFSVALPKFSFQYFGAHGPHGLRVLTPGAVLVPAQTTVQFITFQQCSPSPSQRSSGEGGPWKSQSIVIYLCCVPPGTRRKKRILFVCGCKCSEQSIDGGTDRQMPY